eukprot:TRINITY_DN6982_c1_g1_i1.p1 TRINITY_DN6982_c1_g1~~TRINITY_DN6982_c1_g1_i1.p1  ORF type:complete len:301 (+),score=138.61 TRINITY_DN6982_c1_g1_i1:44-904(+)
MAAAQQTKLKPIFIREENNNQNEDQNEDQEYYDSDFDSYDNDLMPLALPISGEEQATDFPATAEEYLRHVRWEAKQYASIFRANNDLKTYENENENENELNNINSDENVNNNNNNNFEIIWANNFLKQFEEKRKGLIKKYEKFDLKKDEYPNLPSIKFRKEWKKMCLINKIEPTLKLIYSLDEVKTKKLLTYHIEWLQQTNELDRQIVLWLFALLTKVDTLLDADISASLRSLFLFCKSKKLELEALEALEANVSNSSDNNDKIAAASILMIISGKFFGQAAPDEL